MFKWRVGSNVVTVAQDAPQWVVSAAENLSLLWDMYYSEMRASRNEEGFVHLDSAYRYWDEMTDLRDALIPYFVPVPMAGRVVYKK